LACAGTGSKSLLIKDAFVPDHRTHSMLDYTKLDDRPAPMYLFPFSMIFYSSVSSVILGFAQGADRRIHRTDAGASVDNGTGAATRLSPYVKDRLANAVAKVRSCRARMEQMMAHCDCHRREKASWSAPKTAFTTCSIWRGSAGNARKRFSPFTSAPARAASSSPTPSSAICVMFWLAPTTSLRMPTTTPRALGGYLLSGDLPPLMYEKPEAGVIRGHPYLAPELHRAQRARGV
jgi:3-hydroxy-9,10-secoandrosta-1,3,5(10)-triene-9,17-dione monooxygenase